MVLLARGGAALAAALLAAALLQLAAAAPVPQPLQRSLDTAPQQGSASEPAAAQGGLAAAAVAGRRQRRRALLSQPLPNFEIGVPGPPKQRLRQWQATAVRERMQEASSLTFVVPTQPGPGYVALCVVARDAHADLLEWTVHHARLGVSKIYLFDHASEPPMQSVVQEHIGSGLVEYEHFTAVSHPSGKPQMYAYDQCLQRYGSRHTWMGFIDVDEFLMFRDPWPSVQSLPRFLSEFEGPGLPPNAHSGVGVHWLIFGSSGHVHRPPGGVLRSYHRCIQLRHGQHALVKTIVRTECTLHAEGPHNFQHNCSLPVLQTDRTPINGARSEEPVHKRLALHHYAIKSRDEFALKMARGSAMKRQRGWEFFDFIDDWSSEFNFDGLTVWDTQDVFKHYPAFTPETIKRYQQEQHEDFWLKGADDPRYQEQLRQQQAAAAAAARASAAAEAAKHQAAGVAAAQQQQQQQLGGAQQQQQQGAAQQQAAQQQAAGAGSDGLQQLQAQQQVEQATDAAVRAGAQQAQQQAGVAAIRR